MTAMETTARIQPTCRIRKPAPTRIIHLGLGNFMRAHQAWYTEHASNASDWGIAAFTGRSSALVDTLSAQDNAYTLITTGSNGDTCEVISAISEVHCGTDLPALRKLFACEQVCMVTSTITEAGYMRDGEGNLDLTNVDVVADIQETKNNPEANTIRTAPVKVIAGLLARRNAQVGSILFLPCDNISENGEAFKTVVYQAAQEIDPSLCDWLDRYALWATTVVDRITPRTTQEDCDEISREGYLDRAPVRTEPFSEWIISGDLPTNRPLWEDAGAVFTNDITPYENRKLRLLNGAHTFLAYVGLISGCEDVCQAISNTQLRAWVNEWWSMAARNLPIDSEQYCNNLLERFSNPRMHHKLAQIAEDGSSKLRERVVPVALAAERAGKSVRPAARTIAAWILFLSTVRSEQLRDPLKDEINRLVKTSDKGRTSSLVTLLNRSLGENRHFIEEVESCVEEINQFLDNIPAQA